MPFDGTHPDVNERWLWPAPHHEPLSNIFDRMGIKPIGLAVLQDHKTAQCARYPANWTYVHRHKLRAALVVSSFINMFIAGLGSLTYTSALIFGANLPIFGRLALCVMLVNVILAALFPWLRMQAPARWYERVLSPRLLKTVQLPSEVEQLTNRICDHYSGSDLSFTYTELRRNIELLDPYLTVSDSSGAEFVIAIWDGDTILHIAT